MELKSFNPSLRSPSVEVLLAIALFFSLPSMASYENSTAVGVESEEQTLSLLNSLSYSFTADASDHNDEKVYFQGLRYNGTLFFLNQYYAIFGLGVNYHTLDGVIQEDDNRAFHISDLRLGLGTNGFKLYGSKEGSLSLFTNLSSLLPLSEISRHEGYKSISSVSLDLAYQRRALGLVVSGQQTYIWNSFETNLQGFYNPQWISTGSLTARYNWKSFRFQYSYRMAIRNFMDGSALGASGNSLSTIYILNQNLWAGIFTSNMSYADQQFVDPWFYDPFVRIYNINLGATF